MTTLPRNRIEIRRERLVQNISSVRRSLPSSHKIFGVVKANAYGHGLKEIVTAAEPFLDGFQIDDLDELTELRRYTKKAALLLGYVAQEEIVDVFALQATIAVSSLTHARQINQLAAERDTNLRQPVIVAFDSGIGREGVRPESLSELLAELAHLANLQVIGLYSHFSRADEPLALDTAREQMKLYAAACDAVVAAFPDRKRLEFQFHIANTAGSVITPLLNDSLSCSIRLGIGLYGIWPSQELAQASSGTRITLLPVLRWLSWIAQIKQVPPGSAIGYGATYRSTDWRTIAIVPQGYSDGYRRTLSNQGCVLVRGIRCPVIGRVSMNMMTVDITSVPECSVGDEVVLIGEQNNECISAEEIAGVCNTIPYEIFTSISPLLPRVTV